MAQRHIVDEGCRRLAETGQLSLTLAPYVLLTFKVRDSEQTPGQKLLHTELVTGEYHKAVLYLIKVPVLPDEVGSWGDAVHAATREVWSALGEAIENFREAQSVLGPLSGFASSQ